MIRLFSLVLALVVSMSSFAVTKKSGKGQQNKCEAALDSKVKSDGLVEKSGAGNVSDFSQKPNPHKYILIPSGRDSDVLPLYTKFVNKLNDPGGILDQLNIPRTTQVVEFVRGSDMKAITSSSGGQPVPHYLDGRGIVASYMDFSSLIFEVIYPGPDIQHGYYRDDSSYEYQLSILLHVVGHNHFAKRSFLKGYRNSHVVNEAKRLGELMRKLYLEQNKEDVERWYLYLQSLTGLQDFHSAYFQTPEEFKPKLNSGEETGVYKPGKTTLSDTDLRHPRSPTENVLQAFVGNLPSTTPPWKREMAEIMTKLVGYQSALMHTQIMNEGWASLMQELIMHHMGPEYSTFNHWMEAAGLARSEKRPALSDPYWLGLQAWLRLKEKFFDRPEIRSLKTLMEKDRAFIEYADKEIIGKLTDYEFLKLGLDASWVAKYKLSLFRRAKQHEQKDIGKPPANLENPAQYVMTSKDPARIVNAITQSVLYNKTRFRPRVKLNDFSRKGTGEVELVIDDSVGKEVPVKIKSIAPALFVYAQIMKKPVSLLATMWNPEASGRSDELKAQMERIRDYIRFYQVYDPSNREAIRSLEKTLADLMPEYERLLSQALMRVRTVVTPDAKLQVYVQSPDGKSETRTNSDLLFNLQLESLRSYLFDVFMEDEKALEDLMQFSEESKDFAVLSMSQMVNGIDFSGLLDHAPSAAEAIMEYQNFAQRRISAAMALAFKDRSRLKKLGTGMAVKGMPGIPRIQFEEEYIEKIAEEGDVGSVDFNLMAAKVLGEDETHGGTVQPGEGSPGDRVWGPGRSEGGEGEAGNKPGEGANDPSMIPISEELYAKFLGEKVKLPMLNPKDGLTKSTRNILAGRRNRRDGVLRPADTVTNALKKGMALRMLEGLDPLDDTPDAIARGLAAMKPSDYVVKGVEQVPKPDTNAVVVFTLDASGSTQDYYKTFQNFIFDMKALIKSNYKNVEFKFIVFDGEAHVVPEERFFKTFLGGGTDYSAGMKKSLEVLEEFPRAKWDRFVFFVGDLGDFGTEFVNGLPEFLEQVEYSGVFRSGYGTEPVIQGVRQLSEETQHFGYTDTGMDKDYSIDHIRELLKNDPE